MPTPRWPEKNRLKNVQKYTAFTCLLGSTNSLLDKNHYKIIVYAENDFTPLNLLKKSVKMVNTSFQNTFVSEILSTKYPPNFLKVEICGGIQF